MFFMGDINIDTLCYFPEKQRKKNVDTWMHARTVHRLHPESFRWARQKIVPAGHEQISLESLGKIYKKSCPTARQRKV